MKVTQYMCDFNENLKAHDAQLRIIVDGETDAKRDYDACSKHALQMIASSFLNHDTARTITISKVNGASTKVEVKAASSEGVTYKKNPCPAGCGREFAPQGLRAHLTKFHPDFKADTE